MAATVSKSKRHEQLLRVNVRELRSTASGYECVVISSGTGNAKDRNHYPPAALREAVERGLFNGLRCYADHPTASQERERPERSVRDIVGTFEDARFVATREGGEVLARFVPVEGDSYQWVRDLIESSLNGNGNLVGISIDGAGSSRPGTVDGQSVNVIEEVTHLDSADLVTNAGRGGKLIRRLSESAREALQAPPKPRRPVGARKQRRLMREATDALSVALAAEDADAASKALKRLRRVSVLPVKGPGRAAAPAPAPGSPSLAPGSELIPSGPGRPSNDPFRAKRKRRRKMQERLAKLERQTMIERVCREEQLPESIAMLVSGQLREAARSGEQAVREVALRALELDRERQAAGAQALRESLHLDGVEGAGPRGPAPWLQNGHGNDLLASMGIYRHE